MTTIWRVLGCIWIVVGVEATISWIFRGINARKRSIGEKRTVALDKYLVAVLVILTLIVDTLSLGFFWTTLVDHTIFGTDRSVLSFLVTAADVFVNLAICFMLVRVHYDSDGFEVINAHGAVTCYRYSDILKVRNKRNFVITVKYKNDSSRVVIIFNGFLGREGFIREISEHSKTRD